MSYSISKLINGNIQRLHHEISSYELAYDILQGMSEHHKRLGNKVRLYGWQLRVNDNEILYQIGS